MDKNKKMSKRDKQFMKDIGANVEGFMRNALLYKEYGLSDDEIYDLCEFDFEIYRMQMIKKWGDWFEFKDFVEQINEDWEEFKKTRSGQDN